MKIARQEIREEEVIEVEHEGEKLSFHFEPVLKTDYFFLAQNTGFEALSKWILEKKLRKITGAEYEDGGEILPKDAHVLPISVLFAIAGEYSMKIKEYSEALTIAAEPKKKVLRKAKKPSKASANT